MLLSSTCEEKLLDWLSISSWHSGSRNDSQRRTRFIVQYYIDHGEQLNRGELLERMSNIASHDASAREGANKRGNSSRLTQSFHFFMFEPIFSPVNALNQPI